MLNSKQVLGGKGERLALRFLRHQGYQIIAHDFCCRFGQIDIIARQGKTTVFIEVKTRGSTLFGLPQDAIKSNKIKHIRRVAQFYIKNHADPEGEFRFDVVAIVLKDKPEICLIQDAF